jgi:hypothetical protein
MVDTPLMLKEKELLSGVKRTSNVVAPIPLLSMHVASDFEPICRIASTECMKERERMEKIRNMEETEGRNAFCVRFGREKRIAPMYEMERRGVLSGNNRLGYLPLRASEWKIVLYILSLGVERKTRW